MRGFLKFVGIASLVGIVLVAVAAVVLTQFLARDVLFIVPYPPERVELERSLWLEGDPVAEIYGTPVEESRKVVMPDESKLIRPDEDPSLLLMTVDKQAGENPLQAQTVWYFTKFAVGGFAVVGLLAFGGLFLLRRKNRKSPAA